MDRILGNSAMFRGVNPAVVSDLTKRIPMVDFAAGHVFFCDGDTGEEVYIIVSGKVKVGCRADDGRETLFAVMGPSDNVGEISAFDPGPRRSTAIALTAVTAAVLDRAVLMDWVVDCPEIGDRLLRIMARRARRADDQLSALVSTDVPGRLAKQLLRLAQQFGVQDNGHTRVTHDLTQEELAQLVGAARESVNKALSDFSARGWISLDGKSVLITESERLAHRAKMPSTDFRPPPVDTIDVARGMIMERFGLEDSQASILLDKTSRESNRSVSAIAAEIVARYPRGFAPSSALAGINASRGT